MLPITLVLLVATSVFAAPSVNVDFYNINDIPSAPDNGQLVNRFVTDGALEIIDGGDTPLYAQMIFAVINDLAATRDPSSQAAAAIQTVVTIGENANGIPGDACEAAALNNAYAYAVSTGNSAGLPSAVVNFVHRIVGYIDTISQLVVNPNSVRYSAAPSGKCLGGGRSYQFEETWDNILNKANAFQVGLLNEEYCAAKRLYNAFNIRSNNYAAAITAASTPQVNQLAQIALEPLAQFLRSVASNGNVVQSAAVAKNALLQGLAKVQY